MTGLSSPSLAMKADLLVAGNEAAAASHLLPPRRVASDGHLFFFHSSDFVWCVWALSSFSAPLIFSLSLSLSFSLFFFIPILCCCCCPFIRILSRTVRASADVRGCAGAARPFISEAFCVTRFTGGQREEHSAHQVSLQFY